VKPISDVAVRAAGLLMEVRRTRQRLPTLPPELRPQTIDDAYLIQDIVVQSLGGIGAWKIVHPAPGAAPRCSPIPASLSWSSPAKISWDAVLRAEVEVELAVRLGQDLPPRGRLYTVDEVFAAIQTVHPALELLGSRFNDRTKVTPLESLADLLSSAGIVFGDGRNDWREFEFSKARLTLAFDEAEIRSTQSGPSTADVMKTLTWLANHAADRCGGLKAGEIVITGARISPVRLTENGLHITARVENVGSVSLHFDPTNS
jgi:2-keto-4-pentenoate hydratase